MENLTGHSLGRYHILEPLGEGGMAVVYKAYDTRVETDVAVKVIRTENLAPNILERALKRFEREAKSLARLTHPNIVKVMDYGEHEGKPYLVMPYLPGGTLKEKMGKPIPWQEAIQMLLPIAEALDYAHSRNMIHRDVKPSNILMTERGQPMLTDFGIAKILDLEETFELTGTSAAIGTPEYMAPEQATAKSVDHRADIYSLGIVLYEMVTGRKPFIADTPMAVLIMHAHDPLPSPKKYVPNLPNGVEKAFLKALAKKPEDRYQSMAEMAKALEALLKEKSRLWEKSKPVEKPVSKKQEPETQDNTKYETPKRKESRSWDFFSRVIVIGLVTVVILALAVWGISSLPASPQPTQTPPVPDVAVTSQVTATLTPVPATETSVSVTDTPAETSTSALDIGSTWSRPADGMTMVYVPAGEFTMGSNADDVAVECQKYFPAGGWTKTSGGFIKISCRDYNQQNDEEPPRTVNLNAFWIDQTEVTNSMYAMCVSAGVCKEPKNISSATHPSYYGNSEFDRYPAINVDWNMAKTYCGWAGGGLPTEAEWEKAARGVDGRLYPWGNERLDHSLLNYGNSIGDVTEVGKYPNGASPYGAYDMAGNVYEWVSSLYKPYPYDANDGREDLGASGDRVLRGGSWSGFFVLSIPMRSAYRLSSDPSLTDTHTGFRCARSLTAMEIPAPTAIASPGTSTTSNLDVGSTWTRPADGMTMMYVPAGEFSMGSADGKADGQPVHSVTLDAFWMDQTEVTNSMYLKCMDAGKCDDSGGGKRATAKSYPNLPVIATWDMANAYCKWAEARLPTEAEWEKAARGGLEGTKYPWGDESPTCKAGAKNGAATRNCAVPVEVKTFAPNGYGLYDMIGNLWEWVNDWYVSDYYGILPSSNPTGPNSGNSHVLRGGSYCDSGNNVSSSLRGGSLGKDCDIEQPPPADFAKYNKEGELPKFSVPFGSLLGFRCAYNANP